MPNEEPQSGTATIKSIAPGEKTGRQAPSFPGMIIPGFSSGWLGGYPPGFGAFGGGWGSSGDTGVSATTGGSSAAYGECLTAEMLPGMGGAFAGTYMNYRRMLRDPTIQIARATALAPVMMAGWSIEVRKEWASAHKGHALLKREDIAQVATLMLSALWEDYIEDAVRMIDFGWAGFENVFSIRRDGLPKEADSPDAVLWLEKLKPLLVDMTAIDVDEPTGNFAGFTNNNVRLPVEKSLLLTYDGEAGNLYGRARLENVRKAHRRWEEADESAARYDRKVAGVFLIMHYPRGSNKDLAGNIVPNSQIAQRALNSIVAGKGVALPNDWSTVPGDSDSESPYGSLKQSPDGDKTSWKLEMLEDNGGRQAGFNERLKYIDMQKVRGMFTPERAVLESMKAGSKADSLTHQDVVAVQAQLLCNKICREFTRQVLNPWVVLNYGPDAKDMLYVKPGAIVDETREFMEECLAALFTNKPEILLGSAKLISIMKRVGIDDLRDNAEANLDKIRERAEQQADAQPNDGQAVRKVTGQPKQALLSLVSEVKKRLALMTRQQD